MALVSLILLPLHLKGRQLKQADALQACSTV
jgi:hypothetical protein